jgi:hypothetical protein
MKSATALLFLGWLIVSPAWSQDRPAPAIDGYVAGAASTGTSPASDVQRCAEIAGAGPQYSALGRACEYALSGKNLPNYICSETADRSMNSKPLDVVTAEVAFIRGNGDHYSNLTIDGRPVDTLCCHAGWNLGALFGTELNTIFLPGTQTEFKFKRIAKSHAGPEAIYDFEFKAENNRTWSIDRLIRSEDNRTWISHHFYAGFSGSIAVAEESGELQRMEATSTSPDPGMQLISYTISVEYQETSIPDLGSALIPSLATLKACLTGGTCFENREVFHDCREFASKARVLPGFQSVP